MKRIRDKKEQKKMHFHYITNMAMPDLNKNPYPRVHEILSSFNASFYLVHCPGVEKKI